VTVPAIFLDRDGVIIKNRSSYIREWSQVKIFKPALDALVILSKQPYPIVIVTNQSAVGRNLISLSQANEINCRLMLEVEKAGGRIDAVYMCPHLPDANCPCRKPKPGLFYQAAQEMALDLTNSIMIGDALTDIQAARNAGIGQVCLVLTGRGKAQLELAEAAALSPFPVYTNLMTAVEALNGQLTPK
jgi:D-glycero-D-manno-heptose 1,7-bisphosphate phosphatase